LRFSAAVGRRSTVGKPNDGRVSLTPLSVVFGADMIRSPIVAAWNLVTNAARKEKAQAVRMTELFGNFVDLTNDLLQTCQERGTNTTSSLKSSNNLNSGTGASVAVMDDEDNLSDPGASVTPTRGLIIPAPQTVGSFNNLRPSGEVATDPSTSTGELEMIDPSINHTMTYDTVLVKTSLIEGTDLKGSDARGWTHLHFAASQGDMEGAKLLIDAAASKARYERDSLMQVITPPYDHELLNARENGGRSPLTIAIRFQQPKMSLLLIEKGAAVDLRGYYGKSPIFNAILFNDENTLDALPRQNCDLSFVGRDGGTILHLRNQQ
jgi:ankyrin repeat protein